MALSTWIFIYSSPSIQVTTYTGKHRVVRIILEHVTRLPLSLCCFTSYELTQPLVDCGLDATKGRRLTQGKSPMWKYDQHDVLVSCRSFTDDVDYAEGDDDGWGSE
jgi:hypothetical protein